MFCAQQFDSTYLADEDPLYESTKLKRHASMVMRTVGQAVAGLKDVRSLVPVLQGLGAAHAKYGVQPAHFAIVGEALLWTLEQGLGALWTPEVRDAWARTYSVVQSVMEPALLEAAAKQHGAAQPAPPRIGAGAGNDDGERWACLMAPARPPDGAEPRWDAPAAPASQLFFACPCVAYRRVGDSWVVAHSPGPPS